MRSGSTRRYVCRALAVSLLAALRVASPFTAGADGDKKEKGEATSSGADETVYEPGGDVRPPKLVHYVEPAFSSSSKEAFVEGTVRISTVVTADGKPTDARVLKGLNSEEDRTAMEAVMQWRFEPGSKSGANP